MNNPYETLDVPKNASKDTIKKAYRKKAQKSHPDKGGDPAEFQELAGAYALLSDDASRDRFDKTGQTSRDQSDNLLPELAQLLMGAISCVPDVSTTDVIALMNTELDDRARRLKTERTQITQKVETVRKALARLGFTGEGPGALCSVLEGAIRACEQALETIAEREERVGQLRARLEDYVYKVDAAPQPTVWASPYANVTTTKSFFL